MKKFTAYYIFQGLPPFIIPSSRESVPEAFEYRCLIEGESEESVADMILEMIANNEAIRLLPKNGLSAVLQAKYIVNFFLEEMPTSA
jgi:hypothetical protein